MENIQRSLAQGGRNLRVRAMGGKMSPGVHLEVASCALMHPSLLLVAQLRGGTANE